MKHQRELPSEQLSYGQARKSFLEIGRAKKDMIIEFMKSILKIKELNQQKQEKEKEMKKGIVTNDNQTCPFRANMHSTSENLLEQVDLPMAST